MAALFLTRAAALAGTAATVMDIADTSERAYVRAKKVHKSAFARRVPKNFRRTHGVAPRTRSRHRAPPGLGLRPDRGRRLSQLTKVYKRNMPRYGRKRKRRGTLRRRARGRRLSMGRRSGKAKRSRRRGRKAPAFHRLRLYPGGIPLTHKIKLRMMKQCQIVSLPGEWGFIEFSPASVVNPMFNMRTGPLAGANHTAMQWTLKGGTAVTPKPQCYGYDHWIGVTGQNTYRKWKVLGSKTQLLHIPTISGNGNASQLYAGFNPKVWAETDDFGSTFGDTYSNIKQGEISDWINCGVCPNPKIITPQKQLGVGVQGQFTHTYSAKKYARSLRKKGIDDGDWFGEFFNEPVINPKAYFMIADLGLDDTLPQPFSFMLVIDYTIQLSGLKMGDQSEA